MSRRRSKEEEDGDGYGDEADQHTVTADGSGEVVTQHSQHCLA